MIVQPQNIPSELKALDSWVCWDVITRASKPTKTPIKPVGMGPAKCNDPMTWGRFDEAYEAYTDRGHAGIGFVFTEYDPYVGIDIDAHCPPKLRSRIIKAMHSYTEYSPSGNGIHIIARGMLPEYGRKNEKLGIEMYPCKRYFTVTGNLLDTERGQIHDRTETILKIHEYVFPKKPAAPSQAHPAPLTEDDNAIIARIKANPKLHDLFNGTWETHYATQHLADLRLCGALVYFIGDDPARIDRIFRQSGLYNIREGRGHRQEKWHLSSTNGRPYGENTIDLAIRNTRRRVST